MNARILMLAAALAAAPAIASDGHSHGKASTPDKPAANAAMKPAADELPMAEAEVRKVDMDTKKITLRHGEIRNLDMPPMTMVFATKDPVMAGKVKVGDKVKFSAEKINGTFTIVHIEATK